MFKELIPRIRKSVPDAVKVQPEQAKPTELTPYESQTAALRRVIDAVHHQPGEFPMQITHSLEAVLLYRNEHVDKLQLANIGHITYDRQDLEAIRELTISKLVSSGKNIDNIGEHPQILALDKLIANADENRTEVVLFTDQIQTQPPREDRDAPITGKITDSQLAGIDALGRNVDKFLADPRMAGLAEEFIHDLVDGQAEIEESLQAEDGKKQSLGLRAKILRDARKAVAIVQLPTEYYERDPLLLSTEAMVGFIDEQIALRKQYLAEGKMPQKRQKEETKHRIEIKKLKKLKPNVEMLPDGSIREEYTFEQPTLRRELRERFANTVSIVRQPGQRVEVYRLKDDSDEVIICPVDGELDEVAVKGKNLNLHVAIRPADIKRLLVETDLVDNTNYVHDVSVSVEDGDIENVSIDGQGGKASVAIGKGTIGHAVVGTEKSLTGDEVYILQARFSGKKSVGHIKHGDFGRVSIEDGAEFTVESGDGIELAATKRAVGRMAEGDLEKLHVEKGSRASVGGCVLDAEAIEGGKILIAEHAGSVTAVGDGSQIGVGGNVVEGKAIDGGNTSINGNVGGISAIGSESHGVVQKSAAEVLAKDHAGVYVRENATVVTSEDFSEVVVDGTVQSGHVTTRGRLLIYKDAGTIDVNNGDVYVKRNAQEIDAENGARVTIGNDLGKLSAKDPQSEIKVGGKIGDDHTQRDASLTFDGTSITNRAGLEELDGNDEGFFLLGDESDGPLDANITTKISRDTYDLNDKDL